MAFWGGQIEVGTEPTLVSADEGDQLPGSSITFWSPVALAVGGADVTWATGAQVPANTFFPVDLARNERVYACTEAGTTVVHVVRTGV